ncbi:hypothetical protein X943_000420 [Babesia divergens]|uniref:Uncharacterized protein n=1 Tax=Babesia divergens TaxID=32595 RepID=A0AAD9GJU8_BABDI|nr:hypothetical protein X943_000420 [Babesia divergens]
MTFTDDDDEHQLMLDLYDGLDVFSQKADGSAKPPENTDEHITIIADGLPDENYQDEAEQVGEAADAELDDNVYANSHEKDEDNDDGLVFLVEEDEESAVNDASAQNTRPTAKRKPGGWTTRYKKKERIVYVGAPSSEAQAMASTELKKECFWLINGIPWWMDAQQFINTVETLGGVVAFSKLLSDPINGASLGAAIVEFVDGNSGTIFSKAKSQFVATEISDDVFEVIKESSLYREGIFKSEMLTRVVAHLGLSLRKTHATSGISDHFHEIEFEVRQQEMIQSGDFEAVTKMFPWFNLNMLKLMGYAKRNEQPNTDSTYNIENHLEAYKHSRNTQQNYLNMMMPQIMMANYMQHAAKEIGEAGKFPLPFMNKGNPQPDKTTSRQKANTEGNKDRNGRDRGARENERTSRSTSHKRERDAPRGSESPHRKKYRGSSRPSNRSRSRHRDGGRGRNWR